MTPDPYKGIAEHFANLFGQKGIPVAAAKELGQYIGGLEKRIAELDQRMTNLANGK